MQEANDLCRTMMKTAKITTTMMMKTKKTFPMKASRLSDQEATRAEVRSINPVRGRTTSEVVRPISRSTSLTKDQTRTISVVAQSVFRQIDLAKHRTLLAEVQPISHPTDLVRDQTLSAEVQPIFRPTDLVKARTPSVEVRPISRLINLAKDPTPLVHRQVVLPISR